MLVTTKGRWRVIMKYFKYIFMGAAMCSLFASCSKQKKIQVNEGGFYLISQNEAHEMMQNEDVIILDVREEDEYEEGHIKNSILLPVGKIENEALNVIPDKSQTILVYCRSGNRSKIASRTLVELGYKNIYEFGGITTWKYEIVK